MVFDDAQQNPKLLVLVNPGTPPSKKTRAKRAGGKKVPRRKKGRKNASKKLAPYTGRKTKQIRKKGQKTRYMVDGKFASKATYDAALGKSTKKAAPKRKKAAPKRKKSTGVGRGKYKRGKLSAKQKAHKKPKLTAKTKGKKGLVQADPYRKKIKGRRAPGYYHTPGYTSYYRNSSKKRKLPKRGADGKFLSKRGTTKKAAPKRGKAKSSSSSKKLKRISTSRGYRYMRGGKFISKASYDRSMAARRGKKGKKRNMAKAKPRRGRGRKTALWKGMKRNSRGRFIRNGPMGYVDTAKDVVIRTAKPLAGVAAGFFGARIAANLASRATFVPASVAPYAPMLAQLLAGVGVFAIGQKVKALNEYQGPALAGVGLSIFEAVLTRFAPVAAQPYIQQPDPGLGADLDVYEAALRGTLLDDDTAMSVLEAQDMGEYVAEPLSEYVAEPLDGMGEYIEEELAEYFADDGSDGVLNGTEIYEAMAGGGSDSPAMGGVEVYEAMAGPVDDEIDYYLQEAGLNDDAGGVEVEALDGTEVSIFDQGMGTSEAEELDILDAADAAAPGGIAAAKARRRENYMTRYFAPIIGGGIFGDDAIVGKRRGALPPGMDIDARMLRQCVAACYAKVAPLPEPSRMAQCYEKVKATLGAPPSVPFRLAFREAYKAVAGGTASIPASAISRQARRFQAPMDGAPMMVKSIPARRRRPSIEEVADQAAGAAGGMFEGTVFD